MHLFSGLVAIVMTVLLAACGGGGGPPGVLGADGQRLPLSTTAPSSVVIATAVAEQYNIIGGRPPYQVTSSDVQVAIASVVGSNRLSIGGRSSGNATITLSDVDGQKTAVLVTIQDVNGSTTQSSAANVEVLASSGVLPSAGPDVIITAVVKNSSNVGLAGQPVTFSASSGTLQVTSGVSDSSGVVSARLTAGSNKTLRDIAVTVTASRAFGSIVIPVTDTTVLIAGSGSLQTGSTASAYTVRALDSAGAAIVGAPVTATSSLGNTIVLSSPITGSTGITSFSYTPINAGTDTVTVSALGAAWKTTIQVNAVDISVLSPASNFSIPTGTSQAISVRYKNLNVGAPGQTVTFNTTRGTFASSTSVTDANGDAFAVLSSATAGPAIVTAQIAGIGQVTLPVQFAAGNPATVVLQANPSAVQPNAAGLSNNQVSIEALVRDANGNAVANTQVSFSMTQDLSNGRLSPGVALTDGNGRAQVLFIPGASSTATNGVEIQATAGSPGVSGSTSLTVNGQALFITLAFSNLISDLDPGTYTKAFTAFVTDASGVAVANQRLTLSVWPEDYDKGSMNIDTTDSLWKSASATTCSNEDANRNGFLDAGEDGNGDGKLTPGNVALIAPGAINTDTAGRASFDIQYGKRFATWARVRITARATVSGTESVQSVLLRLPVAVADVGDLLVPPVGAISPFGQSGACGDAL